MQLLPSELKCLIVGLLSEYPDCDSLAALARTHTTFQREAEKALYETLYIYASSHRNDSMRCIETLATNSEKAGLVRFLTIEYGNRDEDHQRVTNCLLKSLVNMHSLSDFRVRSWPGDVESEKSIMGLVKILWSVCKNLNHLKSNGFCWRYSQGPSRLQTLYCHDSDVFNISQIIESQPGLHILGIYYPISRGQKTIQVVKTLKEFQNAQMFFPIVFALKHRYSILNKRNYKYITLFYPMFYSVDRRATIPQVLAQSFCKDHNYKGANVRALAIYLIDSSDLPSIYALVKDMAVRFPQIVALNLWFERRCDIVSFLLTIDDYNRTSADLMGTCIILAASGD